MLNSIGVVNISRNALLYMWAGGERVGEQLTELLLFHTNNYTPHTQLQRYAYFIFASVML